MSKKSAGRVNPAVLPKALAPQLATLASAIPSTGDWLYEIKFDGYRILTRFERGIPSLFTRRSHDWTDRMPELARELRSIGIWLKLKCKKRQEFVICGFTDRADDRNQVGSLLLGVHDEDGELIPVGSVGTGWTGQEAKALRKQLAALERSTHPYGAGHGPAKPGRWTRRPPGSEHWVRPDAVAEVAFAEWTKDGQIRHASFVGLRSDKEARSVVRELAP